MKKVLLHTFTLILCIFISHKSDSQSLINESFIHDGLTRDYSIYVPASYQSGTSIPLVLVLHGYTSDKVKMRMYSQFTNIADTANFILVFPNGTIEQTTSQRFWNIGVIGSTVDDKGFLEALIDTVSNHYNINDKRIYSCGMSNGAYMSYLLACQSDKFAAIASVTGSMTTTIYSSCTPTRPIPIMEIHGTADATVPYAGGVGSKHIEDVVSFWVNLNQCDTTPVTVQLPDVNTTDGSTATRYIYSNGINGNTVELFKVTGGGHTWPGGAIDIPSSGNTCRDFSASVEIWRFFSQHTKVASLNLIQPQFDIQVFPVPAHQTITIESHYKKSGDYSIDIKNLSGEKILSKKTSSLITNTLPVKDISKGLYILTIKSAAFQINRKIVIN